MMLNPLQNVLTIQTPEGICFSYHLASPITRFLAWWIDCLVIFALTIIVQQALAMLALISRDLFQAILVLIFFGVSIGYGILLEWLHGGQTIGKRLLRLRVVDANGLQVRPAQIAVRNLLRFIDGFPMFYSVGGVVSLLTRRSQRLGDIAAGTVVIRYPRLHRFKHHNLIGDKFNSFRAYPHLCARLRQRIPQDLALVALQAIGRREQLDPTARLTLFDDIVTRFEAITSFPLESRIGLTAEQYVRNCVDILFDNGP